MPHSTESIRISNKQLMKSVYPEFREWVAQEDYLFSDFCRIADAFETFLFKYVLTNSISSKDIAAELSNVLGECDHLDFTIWEAHAYAIMHFLERYRRFQQIYLLMLKEGILPVRQKTSNILDVGTGPAMALYSLSDILELLRNFGHTNNVDLLSHLNYGFDYVERSEGFRQFLHIFTEFCSEFKRYVVPFHLGTFREFNGLNFQHEKNMRQQHLIDEEMKYHDDADESISRGFAQKIIDEEKGGWKDSFRYNMIIFSNFLTCPSQVDKHEKELASSFKALRNGGTIVFVGGNYGKYPEIYKKINALMMRVGKGECKLAYKNPNMSHRLDDPCSKRIREFHKKILNHLNNLGAGKDIPEKANGYIEKIIENIEGEGEITWFLCVFQKRLKKRY